MLMQQTYLSTGQERNPADFDARAMSLDAWLDTPAGIAWLGAEAEASEMRIAAETFGSRPGYFTGGHRHADR